jgi:hypothetical protein
MVRASASRDLRALDASLSIGAHSNVDRLNQQAFVTQSRGSAGGSF